MLARNERLANWSPVSVRYTHSFRQACPTGSGAFCDWAALQLRQVSSRKRLPPPARSACR